MPITMRTMSAAVFATVITFCTILPSCTPRQLSQVRKAITTTATIWPPVTTKCFMVKNGSSMKGKESSQFTCVAA